MAKKSVQAVDTSVLVPVQEKIVTVGTFLRNITPFFKTAGELEHTAHEALDRAKTWTRPTTLEEDAALVQGVKDVKATRTKLADHWSARDVIFALHKKLVAAYQRAEKPLVEAESIGTRLHNEWVESERLRVQREEDEKRRIAQEAERERQRAEAARLEQEAEAAELASEALSDREQRFVAFVVAGKGDSEAAQLAGYKMPGAKAAQLRLHNKITEAIDAAERAIELRRQAQAVAAQPVAIEDVAATTPAQVATTGRTTYSAIIFNADAFVAAAVKGGYGIPADCLMPNPVKLNEYARSLRERLDAWPGVRLSKKTSL